MVRVCTDRLTSALRQVASEGEGGLSQIEQDRPPVFDYLLAARLIKEVHLYPEFPHHTQWVLTDAGKEELKRIDNRFKRHLALVIFFSIMLAPTLLLVCRAISTFIPLPDVSALERICGLIGLCGVFTFLDLLGVYLEDYGLVTTRGNWWLNLISITILILSLSLSCILCILIP